MGGEIVQIPAEKAALKGPQIEGGDRRAGGQVQDALHENLGPDLLKDVPSAGGKGATAGAHVSGSGDSLPAPDPADKLLPKVALAQSKSAPAANSDKGGWTAVVGDLAEGAWNEAKDHHWQLAKDFAIGAVAGAAAVVAGPEIALVAGAALAVGAVEINGGFAKLGGELVQGAENFAHNAGVVAAPEGHSAAEQNAAKSGLENDGAIAAQITAGVAGGVVGGIGAGALSSALKSGAGKIVDLPVSGADGSEAGTLAGGAAGTAGGTATDTATVTAKVVAAAGDGADKTALSQGDLTLSKTSLAQSSHAEVNAGQLTSPDGTVQDVYFHSAAATPEATAARLANEQAGFKLNKIIGFDNPYPQSEAVSLQVGNETRAGWLQQSTGTPLEDELRQRAVAQFGTSQNMDQDVAKILAADPALQAKVEQAAVERMIYGDGDIAARNIGVSGSGANQTVANMDLGEAFGTNTVPELSSHQPYLATIGLQNALSGKPLSAGITQTLTNFLDKYDNAAGVQSLSQTGLNQAQIEGVLGRTRWLVDNGALPKVDASVNAPGNIAWYQQVERDDNGSK